MATPVVTIVSVSQYVISDEVSKDRAVITFTFDTDITEWTVRVMGTSYNTGILADSYSGTTITAGTQITAEIDWTELYQEGENRVNIYGKNLVGWTPYDGAVSSESNITLTFAE